MYSEVQILVIWNNHETGVLMNGRIKCAKNLSRNRECMHVKCKFVVTMLWNNFVEVNSLLPIWHYYVMFMNYPIVAYNYKPLSKTIMKGISNLVTIILFVNHASFCFFLAFLTTWLLMMLLIAIIMSLLVIIFFEMWNLTKMHPKTNPSLQPLHRCFYNIFENNCQKNRVLVIKCPFLQVTKL
jgi:fatty acid desaturase